MILHTGSRFLVAAACAVLPLSVAHCSSDPDTPGTGADAAPDVLAAETGALADAPSSDAAVDPPDALVSAECGTSKLCLDVTITPAADYRVTVFWFQLDDDGPDPAFEVVYGAPVASSAKRVEIATSAVKAPTDEKNLLCERASDDESVSPCQSDPKVGYALVMAYADNDGDAQFSAGDTQLGIANAIFGYSEKAYAPGTAPTQPASWDRLWPKGIEAGVRIYQVERPDGGHDRPVPSGPGIVNILGEKGPNLS